MAFTLEALKDEIVADALALGYKNTDDTWTVEGGATPKGDQEIADLLNATDFVVDVASVDVGTIRSLVWSDYEWYNDLAIDEQEMLRWQTSGTGTLDVTAGMKLSLTGRTLAAAGVGGTGDGGDSWWGGVVAQKNASADAMLALIEKAGSRAEVLWGPGTTISSGQVGSCFNLVVYV